MNSEDLKVWQDDVMIHCHTRETILNDRVILKQKMIDHLKEFFDYDEIKFDKDFNKIEMKWAYASDPVIRNDSLENLGMDFIITTNYDDKLGQGVVIELYPFGVDNLGEED